MVSILYKKLYYGGVRVKCFSSPFGSEIEYMFLEIAMTKFQAGLCNNAIEFNNDREE